jgi:hypothetical protein
MPTENGESTARTAGRINKSLFLGSAACTTYGWYLAHEVAEEPTPAKRLRMAEGQEIGRKAWSLYPDGVVVRTADFDAAIEFTARQMRDAQTTAIFEATFSVDGYAAKADMLVREGAGWRLLEVKSSLHDDDKVKPEHINDLAYTAMVLTHAGVKLVSAALVRLSRDWRLGDSDVSLFRTRDCSSEVFKRMKQLDVAWATTPAITLGAQRPAPRAIYQCRECQYFETTCLGKGVEDSVFDIPRLGEKKFAELAAAGALTISALPERFVLTDPQRRVVQCVRAGEPVLDRPAIERLLGQVAWPAFYLDFETVMTALPLWPRIAPYEQVVTQFSIHVCGALGDVPDHREYLADSTRDCRRELAEQLLLRLEGKGSIIVYSSFEKTIIGGLARHFPELAARLENCVARLFDLEGVFREGYCHPKFRGRTSIKVTLPVLVPAMNYSDLAIGDGETAIAAFASMARGECSEAQSAERRAGLLRYCRQDTLAMVELHGKLAGLVSPN